MKASLGFLMENVGKILKEDNTSLGCVQGNGGFAGGRRRCGGKDVIAC